MDRRHTEFLKFIAIGLVLNSHLDRYYPITHIGTGGGIGNVLFFMLSSFGLLLSERRKPQTLVTYLMKRIRRIFPPVWFVLAAIALPIQLSRHPWEAHRIWLFLKGFLIPPFWFLQALMIYYLIGFILIKRYHRLKLAVTMGLAVMVYTYFYLNYLDLSAWSIEAMPFKLCFYVMVFLLGIFIAEINEKIVFKGRRDVVIFTVIFLIFYGHKYLMSINLLLNIQFVQQILLLIMGLYALKISRSAFVCDHIMQMPVVSRIIKFISGITLELYIVHVTISPLILKLNYPFPANAIVFLTSSFIIALVVKWAVNKIRFWMSWSPIKAKRTG